MEILYFSWEGKLFYLDSLFSLTFKIFQFTFSPHESPMAVSSSAAVNTKIYLCKMGSRREESSSLLEEIYVNDFMWILYPTLWKEFGRVPFSGTEI